MTTSETEGVLDLDRFLATAPLLAIGELLTEVDYLEPDRFPCPRCQRTAAQQVLHQAAAYGVSALWWTCSACQRSGSRWALAAAVRNRSTSLERLVAAAKADREGADHA